MPETKSLLTELTNTERDKLFYAACHLVSSENRPEDPHAGDSADLAWDTIDEVLAGRDQRVLADAGVLRTPEASAGVPLTWLDDERGYQCPECSLFVTIPRRAWATCPRCPSRPVEEVADLLLGAAGFDEDERTHATEALRPLIDGLLRAALGGGA